MIRATIFQCMRTTSFGSVHSTALGMLPNGRKWTLKLASLQLFLSIAAGHGFASNAFRPELMLQSGHSGMIQALAFSDDGSLLASGAADNAIKVWDVRTGILTATLKCTSEVEAVAFTYDRKFLAAGTLHDQVEIWDLASLRLLKTVQGFDSGDDGKGIAFSPNGRLLAITSSNATVLVLEAPSWTLRSTLRSHGKHVDAIAFSPNGELLASGSRDHTVGLWDPLRGVSLASFTDHLHPVGAVAFSADGTKLVSADDTQMVITWGTISKAKIATFQVPKARETGANTVGTTYFLSRDGEWLALGGNGFVRFLRLDATEEHVVEGHENIVLALSFSSDTRLLASAAMSDSRLILWDVRLGTKVRTIEGYTDSVNDVTFSPDGRLLASVGDNGTQLWDLVDGSELGPLDDDEGGYSVTFSSDGKWLAAAANQQILIWDLGRGTVVHEIDVPRRAKSLDWFDRPVRFSRDRRWLVCGSAKELKLWDTSSWQEVKTLSSKDINEDDLVFDNPRDSAFSPDGLWYVASGANSDIEIYRVSDWARVRTIPSNNHYMGDVIVFSHDGKNLVTGDGSGIRVFSVGDWKEGTKVGYRPGLNDGPNLLACDFTRHRLVFRNGSDISFVDIESSRTIFALSGHTGRILAAAFSGDGRWLASVSEDGSTRIWDLQQRTWAVSLIETRGPSEVHVESPYEGWLVVAPDGLFDGTANAMRLVAWRANNTSDVVPLDSFFTDFYRPALLAQVMSGEAPKASVDIATAIQVPGLRLLLSNHLAHLEPRGNRLLVCFAVEPGVAVNIAPGDRRVVIPTIRGYGVNRNDAACEFWKELPTFGTDSKAVIQQLQNWKPELVTTAWDGKHSDTQHSTLHVLTVGVSQYPSDSGFSGVSWAVPSSKAIEGFFRDQKASPKKPYASVRVWDGIYDQGATLDKIRQRLSDMVAEVGENDVVLMYLAGHGRVVVGEEMFYFVPVDGLEPDLRNTAVSTAMIAEALRHLRARRIVLIIDACQSGGAIEALSKIGVVKAHVEQERARHEKNLPGHEHGVGMHLIAATLPLSFAVGPAAGESALAETLLTALQRGRGMITIDQLSAYVTDELPRISAAKQHGFRQVPLIDSIGLDFPVAAR